MRQSYELHEVYLNGESMVGVVVTEILSATAQQQKRGGV